MLWQRQEKVGDTGEVRFRCAFFIKKTGVVRTYDVRANDLLSAMQEVLVKVDEDQQ